MNLLVCIQMKFLRDKLSLLVAHKLEQKSDGIWLKRHWFEWGNNKRTMWLTAHFPILHAETSICYDSHGKRATFRPPARACWTISSSEYIRYKSRRVCMSLSAWSVFCLLSCHLFKHNYRMTFWNFGQKVISIFTCELNVFCRCSCWQSNSQLMFVCLTMINYVSSSARRGQELISSV